ncbi:hypothetical protein JVU11DRAFT_9178 [Chiua virens]|nr:hypothetical protein JVU11DRAFT_9178 [Chiua virens]
MDKSCRPSNSDRKGKAPLRHLHSAVKLLSSTDSDLESGGSGSDVEIIETIDTTTTTRAATRSTSSGIVTTTGDKVAPSASNTPRLGATAHPSPAVPDSGSDLDDEFNFFTKLIARESDATIATGSKRPRHVSLSELASDSHPSGSGKRIKSESYRTGGFQGVARNGLEAFDEEEVAEAGPTSGSIQGTASSHLCQTPEPPATHSVSNPFPSVIFGVTSVSTPSCLFVHQVPDVVSNAPLYRISYTLSTS